MLYEALTGRLPHSGNAMKMMMDKQYLVPAPPSACVPDLPEDLHSLCENLLAIDPSMRPTPDAILKVLSGADNAAPKTSTKFTQTTPFIGRKQELNVLRECYQQAQDKAVVLFVDAESGMGKSELVDHFIKQVQFEDAQAVSFYSRCYERESIPYKAFDGIADDLSRYWVKQDAREAMRLLPRRAQLLSRLFPVLGRVRAISGEPEQAVDRGDPQEIRRQMFACFRSVLQQIADDRPLILYIDDFQWADPDSVLLFQELMHPPDAPKVLVICTIRTEGLQDVEMNTVAGADADVRSLSVGPLAYADATELVKALGVALTPEQRAVITVEGEGHPLFLQEMIRSAITHPELSGAMQLDLALWERIKALGGNAQNLVELLSVSGVPIPQEIALIAGEFDATVFYDVVQTCRTGQLAKTSGLLKSDTIECYHDRIREAALAHLDEGRRGRLHTRLAAAFDEVQGKDADAYTMVRHLMGSGNHQRAAKVAEAAAAKAEEGMAFLQSAELYALALQTGSYTQEKERRLRLLWAEVLVNSGKGKEAGDLYLVASEGMDEDERLRCELLAGAQFLYAGYIEEGLDAMGKVMADIGETLPKKL